MSSWQLLNGELNLEPINKLQFRWNALNSSIEDEGMRIKPIAYKLSTLGSNQRTQQAQKHPNSV